MTRKLTVVSTFPVVHSEIYGNRFLEECSEFNIPLTLVHYEDFSSVPNRGELRVDATIGGQDEDRGLWQWRHRASGLHHTSHYRWQAARFAWKAFAMTRNDIRNGSDFLIWLDADVRITGAPDWGAVLSDEHDVGYLGRAHWDHSETGFLCWNLKKRGNEGLDAIRDFYASGWIFSEPQWHDAWVFDRVRQQLRLNCHNLSPDAKGLDAWEASPLAEWSRHMKGNRKFSVIAGAMQD